MYLYRAQYGPNGSRSFFSSKVGRKHLYENSLSSNKWKWKK